MCGAPSFLSTVMVLPTRFFNGAEPVAGQISTTTGWSGICVLTPKERDISSFERMIPFNSSFNHHCRKEPSGTQRGSWLAS